VPTTRPARDSSWQLLTIAERASASSMATSGCSVVTVGNGNGNGVLDDVIGWRDGHIIAIDQTALPHQLSVLHLTTVDQLVDAIVRLVVRGAPLLGVAGALGVALAARQAEREGWDVVRLDAEVKRIADARPTAVNLRREVLAVAAALPGGAGAVEAAALAVRDAAVKNSMRLSER